MFLLLHHNGISAVVYICNLEMSQICMRNIVLIFYNISIFVQM